jgi:uncharacterized protein YjlB
MPPSSAPSSWLCAPSVETYRLTDDGTYPNNDHLPTLRYHDALDLSAVSGARTVETLLRQHRWGSTWRNGIFGYHHYHSTAHEVLVVTQGTATVRLGGPEGVQLDVASGDAMVLPAGVAHKNEGASPDFRVVGAYPEGQDWDLRTGDPGDRPEADRNIAAVPMPVADPLYGPDGPLVEHWLDA